LQQLGGEKGLGCPSGGRLPLRDHLRARRCLARIVRTCILPLVALTTTQSARARTWIVKPDASGDRPTIQQAILAAASGDSILLWPGIFYENLDMRAKQLVLRGRDGATCTVIDGQDAGRVLWMNSGTVEGITIRNGACTCEGAGIFIDGGPAVVRDCIVEENVAGLVPDAGTGGGLWVSADPGYCLIQANVIRRNIANYAGGGIAGYGVLDLIDNIVLENHARNSGGGVVASPRYMTGNLVAGNTALYAAAGIDVRDGEIRNNTIVSNHIEQSTGLANAVAFARFENNIIALNGSASPWSQEARGLWARSTFFQCNDIWGNDIDEVGGFGNTGGNFSADPLFCGASTGDYHLDRRSPCLSCMGLVGAYDAACGSTSVVPVSWSSAKGMYR